MRCECGCDWQGHDPVTQWLLEEAAFLLLDTFESRGDASVFEDDERYARLMAMANRAVTG